MKNRLLALLMTIVMVISALSMSACSKTAEEDKGTAGESQDLLSTIQERGTIIIATEGCWAPWTYHDENDNLVGFDIEVAQAIAEKLGVEAEFVEVEWDGILAGVDSGRYDTAANGVEVDEDRLEKYNFTDPYAFIHTALIVRNDNTDIESFEDLAGKTTANTLSSTYAAIAESFGADVTGVDDLAETMELLIAGRIDATLNANVSFYDYVEEHPEAEIHIAALTEEASNVCLPLRKDSSTDTLREAITNAISELRAEGKLSEISIKYFGDDITGTN